MQVFGLPMSSRYLLGVLSNAKESLSCVQLVVSAEDERGGRSNASVIVSVSRDQEPPEFRGAPYQPGTVSENLQAGRGVYTVRAQDPDLKVRVE